MSRSYKKTPICKIKSHYSQTLENRKFRRNKNECTNGNAYKKFAPSYDVIDYIWYETIEYRIKKYYSDLLAYKNGNRCWDPKKYIAGELRNWFKCYYRK